MTNKKLIIDKIYKETGLKVGLSKVEGVYYWYDDDTLDFDECIVMHFFETCVNFVRFGGTKTDEWVDDFKMKLEAYKKSLYD